MDFQASYLDLQRKGELENRWKSLHSLLKSCELCPRKCGVNRLEGELGYCKMGKELEVSSFGPHFGEESVLVGVFGSGTVFLTGCNLLCIYCQNFDISHYRAGVITSEKRAAEFMLNLQRRGCHNINFVTPTHFTAQLVKAVDIAAKNGLKIPIVWNCSGYENVDIIKYLEGIVDIYMPDIKYGNTGPAKMYSDAPDYFDRCKEAIAEMHRQVGNLKTDDQGIAYRGLLVRHLVLPENQSGSNEVLNFLSNLSKDVHVNIMDQYRPDGKAHQYNKINRRITSEEFNRVVQMAKNLRLKILDK